MSRRERTCRRPKGGELSAASVFISEYAAPQRRGLATSLIYMSGQAGNTVATVVVLALQALLPPSDFGSWRWRIGFWLAIVPSIVILYIRLRTEDTPVFRALDRAGGAAGETLSAALRKNWRAILQVSALAALGSPYFLIATYFPIYFTGAGMSPMGATLIVLVLYLVIVVAVPFAGALSDRIGRKRQLMASALTMIVLVVPAFAVAGSGGVAAGMAGGVLLVGPLVLYLGAYPATLSEMFGAVSRGTGASVGFGLGTGVFAVLPLVVAAMSAATGNALMPAYCVLVVAVIGLAAVLTLPGARLTGAHSLHGDGGTDGGPNAPSPTRAGRSDTPSTS